MTVSKMEAPEVQISECVRGRQVTRPDLALSDSEGVKS